MLEYTSSIERIYVTNTSLWSLSTKRLLKLNKQVPAEDRILKRQ